MSRWVAEIASWAMEWPEGHWTGCCLCMSAVAANSLIHYWSPYLSVVVDQSWIFTKRWNVNFLPFWKLTFHWKVKKHPLGNKVNKCRYLELYTPVASLDCTHESTVCICQLLLLQEVYIFICLSDLGVPGVRSMGPVVSHSLAALEWLFCKLIWFWCDSGWWRYQLNTNW